MSDRPHPWIRRDLTDVGMGRALVIAAPRAKLTYWRSTEDYAVTAPDGATRTRMRLGAVLEWCGDAEIVKPTNADLAWLVGAS